MSDAHRVGVPVTQAIAIWRGVGLRFDSSPEASNCTTPPGPGFIFAGKLFVHSPQGPRCFCVWHDGTSTSWTPCED